MPSIGENRLRLDFLKQKVLDLMEQVSSRVSGSPELWYQFSRLRGALGSPLEAIDCLLKRHRALQQPGWEHDEGRCQLVCENLVDYCQSIVALSSSPSPDSPSQGAELPVKTADKKKLLMQAKLTVGGILKRLEALFSNTEWYQALRSSAQELQDEAAVLV